MKIRAMGSADLIHKMNDLLGQFNAGGRVYDNRGQSRDKRLYLDFDDRDFEQLLNKFQGIQSTIKELEKKSLSKLDD